MRSKLTCHQSAKTVMGPVLKTELPLNVLNVTVQVKSESASRLVHSFKIQSDLALNVRVQGVNSHQDVNRV